MKAAVFHGPGDLRVEEVPVPKVADDEVLIEVEACGVCGTDIHILSGDFPLPRHPVILGHEFAGRVCEVGKSVSSISIGEHVTADINLSCGHCYYCRRQEKLLCPDLQQIGLHRDGGFAQYVSVPAASVHVLPESLTPGEGAYVEPLACVIHGQERANIQYGSSVAIIGAGPMGLAHIALARLRGASKIIVTEIREERQKRASALGADHVIDPDSVDAVDAVLSLTEGRGADLVIEAVGSASTYAQAMNLVRRGGTVLAFGAPSPSASINVRPFDVFSKELTIIGSYAGSYSTWPEAISLLESGRFDAKAMISDTLPLDAVVTAIRDAETKASSVKIQIVP